jgi:hypothetical protein
MNTHTDAQRRGNVQPDAHSHTSVIGVAFGQIVPIKGGDGVNTVGNEVGNTKSNNQELVHAARNRKGTQLVTHERK